MKKCIPTLQSITVDIHTSTYPQIIFDTLLSLNAVRKLFQSPPILSLNFELLILSNLFLGIVDSDAISPQIKQIILLTMFTLLF